MHVELQVKLHIVQNCGCDKCEVWHQAELASLRDHLLLPVITKALVAATHDQLHDDKDHHHHRNRCPTLFLDSNDNNNQHPQQASSL